MSICKGKKRVINTLVLYDEPENIRGIYLTDTSWSSVQELAAREKVSTSESVECLIIKYSMTEA